MDAALVEHEMIRRQYWCSIISMYISQHFATGDSRSRLRRGTIQKEMGAYFGITVNNLFCELVNLCMENEGFTKIINRGDYYYKNVKRRTNI